jgi:hypothetical protein
VGASKGGPRRNPHRQTADSVSEFAESIIQLIGVEKFSKDPLAPQVMTAYAYGAVCYRCQQDGLTPADARGIHIAFLLQYCGLAEEQAVTMSGDCDQALTAHNPESDLYRLYGVAHRGMDSYRAWHAGDQRTAAKDFVAVVKELKAQGMNA